MNRQQQAVIEYLQDENRILREKLGRKRIILNDSRKRRLATAAMKLGRDLLRQFGTLFSPETLLAWHRKLVAREYGGSSYRGKRGPVPTKVNMIRKLMLEMAGVQDASPATADVLIAETTVLTRAAHRGARCERRRQ